MRSQHRRLNSVRILVVAALFLVGLLSAMITLAPVAAATVSTIPAPIVLAHTYRSIDSQELQQFLDHEIPAELAQDHIPGATISVVQDGQVLASKGYGYADLASHTPVQADSTLFRAGSVSKLFTWTAVMQLAEAGKVDLHADINQYIKTFTIPATYPQPITLADLMTHTAGFEEVYNGLFADRPSDLQPLGQWLAQHIPARVYPPGTVTAYSNYGGALAGYIVQQVSGEPFDQYIAEHILQPLQMQHTSFDQPVPANLAGQLATGYSQNAQGSDVHPQSFETIQVWPAGSLSTTATDMAHFMIAQLQDGQYGSTTILQTATAEEMHAQHFDADPRVPGMAYGFYQQVINGQSLLAHGGDTRWFHTNLVLLPAQQVGIFVSYNSPLGEFARDKLLQAFMDRFFPQAPAPLPTELLPGYAERAQHITGEYQMTRRVFSSWEKLFGSLASTTVSASGNGHLSLNLAGMQMHFVEIAPWEFQQIDGQQVGILVFQTDTSGNVKYMLTGNLPVFEFTKDAWYETTSFHLVLFVSSLVILITAILSFAITGIVAFIRRRRGVAMAKIDPQSRWARVLASLTAVLDLGVVFLMLLAIASISSGSAPATELPMVLLGVLATGFSVWIVVTAVRAWIHHQWNVAWRVHYSLVMLAMLTFVFEMVFWNVLSFHLS